MEILARLGIAKYYRTKTVESQSEGVEKIFIDNIDSYIDLGKWDCNNFRKDQIWKDDIVIAMDRNMKWVKEIYAKYSTMKVLPGEQKYMCYDEFMMMINQTDILFMIKAGPAEMGAIFNVSMMT